jgi:MFS family permease
LIKYGKIDYSTRPPFLQRLGLIYSSASLSGAFGGLLARGLNEMGGRGGLEGWRWIIIIEGILTALVGVMAYFVLPDTVDKAKFLDPEEKHLATQRLLRDRPVELDESGRVVVIVEQFKWKDILAPVLSPMVSSESSLYAFFH